MIDFREIVGIFITPKMVHGDSDSSFVFRIQIANRVGGFVATIHRMDSFTLKIDFPIKIGDDVIDEVGANVEVFDDFISNYPNEIVGASIGEVLRVASDRIISNGYVSA